MIQPSLDMRKKTRPEPEVLLSCMLMIGDMVDETFIFYFQIFSKFTSPKSRSTPMFHNICVSLCFLGLKPPFQ